MLVTGELPFKSNGPLDAWMKKMQNELIPPKDIVPTLSDRVNWAILRAMSADREQRPRSCREFVEDLTGHSTKRVATTTAGASASTLDIWYLIYKDEEGATHTVKGTTAAIRRSLKDGLLGDAENIRTSRTKTGPFESLREHPEFRDLIISAQPVGSQQASPSAPRVGTDANRQAYQGQPGTSGSGMPAAPADAGGSAAGPHIDMGAPKKKAGLSWFTWLMVLLVTAGSAAAAVYLYQRWPWPF
jgi:hypothetical protein